MKQCWTIVLLVLLVGCEVSDEVIRAPAPGPMPTKKREWPWLTVPGGRMRTTLFYGPWQCNQRLMTSCRRECAIENRQLKGCMWLADMKLDWQGSLIVLPIPVNAGGRYAIWHCCCDYTQLKPEETEALRRQWENQRTSFRRDWSQRFGDWPTEGGKSWPGHHVRDLGHGGNPTDPNNILPTPPDVHDVFSKQYPACYAGGPPWSTVGPDLPYTDN